MNDEQTQQPSDSEPDIVEDLRKRLAECEVLLAEADRGGQQVNAELQQLREQVRDLTRELKDKSDSYQICLRNHYKAGQRSAIDRLQTWLRPVIELVAEHPDDCSPLAVSVLGYLPGIASRLIEE
jgi:chromosome segregation ATPase